MTNESENQKNRLQLPHDDEKIRTDDLIRVTQGETKENPERLENIPVRKDNYRRFKGDARSSLPKGIKWAAAGLVILFIGGSLISFYLIRRHITKSIVAGAGNLQAGVQDLQNLDPTSAEQQFSSLSSISSQSGLFGMLGSLFQGGTGAVRAFDDLSGQLTVFAQDFGNVEKDVFNFSSPGASGDLVSSLNSMKTVLAAVDSDSDQLSGIASYFGSDSPLGGSSYLSTKAQVEGAEKFLNVFVPWLAASSTHHVLILLDNPSEMRPGGGFLGSYADVSIASGSIEDISVHDVADVDTAFTQNIVPPKPLQLEVTRWRPADANWFFDFPTSASETISFFERSGLYAGSSTTFDGAIAVSPKVISDLLSVTGPVTVGSPSTTFTSDNLVVQIQKIVQAGQAQSATYPKGILGQLSSALFEKLASSTDDEKQQLVGMMLDWITKKDVMVYFKDPDFENFVNAYAGAGETYELPQNFNGDYLAVVNADINSDKSELYVSQSVTFQTEINSDGTVTDHLVIDRTHDGNESPYWWYKTTNQDYIQIFTPEGSTLSNETGGITKSVPAPLNYAKKGYAVDPLVAAIDASTQPIFNYPKVSTHDESGKNVFSLWSRVAAGASTEVTLDYSHRLFSLPAAGEVYQFIFEKQPGATGQYEFQINAPLGFKFAENGLAAYDYKSDDPPGRLVISLTLESL